MAEKRSTIADAWAGFGDAGRCALIAGAVLLPLRRRNWNGSFDGLTAVLASAATCKAIKPFVPERRPNGEDADSFPSQHAAECFAAGLALRRHFGQDAGAPAIGLAAMVSMSRLFAKKHFLVDVLAGIVIGTTASMSVAALEGTHR